MYILVVEAFKDICTAGLNRAGSLDRNIKRKLLPGVHFIHLILKFTVICCLFCPFKRIYSIFFMSRRSTCWSPPPYLWWRGLALTGMHLISRYGTFTFSYFALIKKNKKHFYWINIWLFFFLSPQVMKRGMAPGGGGEVFFSCPACRSLKPVQLTDPGKIKRIRGVAYPSQTWQ